MNDFTLVDAREGELLVRSEGVRPYDGVRMSDASTVDYDPNTRKGFCIAKDHTCQGRQTKDSKYCQGHKRALEAGK